MLEKDYLKTLADRKEKSHVYSDFQHTGLIIAQMLADEKHKALYIKLAKYMDKQTLMAIAKDISRRPKVINGGAYFMELIKQKGLLNKFKKESWSKKKSKKKSGQLKLKVKSLS
jgi:hypothetical protein